MVYPDAYVRIRYVLYWYSKKHLGLPPPPSLFTSFLPCGVSMPVYLPAREAACTRDPAGLKERVSPQEKVSRAAPLSAAV